MSLQIAPFIVRKIENHYLFLFPDIPYWFTVDSQEKRDTVIWFLHRIQNLDTVDQNIRGLDTGGPYAKDLHDLFEALKKAQVLTPHMEKKGTPVPRIPRIAQVSVEVTKGCNLTCQHCSVAAGSPRENELSVSEINTLLREVIYLMKGRKEVVITGGEPFLRSDIFDILELGQSLGFKRILLLTNGTLIGEEIGEKLSELNQRIESQNTQETLKQQLSIQVSIDGREPTHDSIRGKNAWKRAINGIKILKEHDIFTSMAMVLNDKNIVDVPAVIELAGTLDCSLGFSSMVQTGRGGSGVLNSVNSSRVIPVVMEYMERDPRYIKYLANFPHSPYVIAFQNLIKFRYCGTGWATVYINSGGDVFPCQIGATVPEFKVGNIRQTSFTEIWEHAPLLKKLRNLHVDTLNEQCAACEIRYFCGGGCRTEAYLATGRLDGMSPKCLMGEYKQCAWGAFQLIVKYPQILEEVSELGIVRLMEGLFEEMAT